MLYILTQSKTIKLKLNRWLANLQVKKRECSLC